MGSSGGAQAPAPIPLGDQYSSLLTALQSTSQGSLGLTASLGQPMAASNANIAQTEALSWGNSFTQSLLPVAQQGASQTLNSGINYLFGNGGFGGGVGGGSAAAAMIPAVASPAATSPVAATPASTTSTMPSTISGPQLISAYQKVFGVAPNWQGSVGLDQSGNIPVGYGSIPTPTGNQIDLSQLLMEAGMGGSQAAAAPAAPAPAAPAPAAPAAAPTAMASAPAGNGMGAASAEVQGYLQANPALAATLMSEMNFAGGNAPGFQQLLNSAATTTSAGNRLMGLGSTLTGYGNQLAAGTPLLAQENQLAQSELATNGNLSQQEQDQTMQAVAQQFAGSGLGGASAGIADAALSLDSARNARLVQYQNFASNVQGQNVAQQNAATGAYGAATGADTAGASAFGTAGNLYGNAASLMNTNNQNMFSLAALMNSPIDQLQSNYLNLTNNIGSMATGLGSNTSQTNQNISPQLLSWMGDNFNTQYNAQAGANIANAQASSAQTGALIGGTTALVGSLAVAGAVF